MDLLSLVLAQEAVASAVAHVPSTVPASWSGPAATACQTRLDELRLLLTDLSARVDNARTAAAAVDDPLLQCVAS
ncbi:hypothetical protein [Actinomyces urogenitalis]|uniref:hypothetical protein n=1 Tax=Actinomyces urogenitalis TaxID=103621 RepID=UPI002432029C|nr:hypothetical protein [Actinomyces urogenitalis]MCI7457326.1 hypothetical protein [Actinomyces urogenitalis]